MTTKKTGLSELQNRIAQIVREEIYVALKEDVNPHLKRVRDKDKMIAWIMRQYFDPSKHADKLWYDTSVNEENVLDYVSDPKKHFPLTPNELADLWRLKKSLGTSMELATKDLERVPAEDTEDKEEEKEKVTYQTGETTLKDIGTELGGLTPTMINKLVTSGSEKVKKLTKGVAPWEMDDEQWEELISVIKDARLEVAQEYAEKLKVHEGRVNAFLESLVKEHILTPSDLRLVSDEEAEGLRLLSQKPVEQIVNVLLHDIERDDNVFKSYQSSVSKKVFPPAKRGRPKKSRE